MTWINEGFFSTTFRRLCRDAEVEFALRYFLGGDRLEESSDLVVSVPAPDDYAGLPAKVFRMIEWAIVADFDFVFKTDDDTYVRPERLLASGFDRQRHDYVGWTRDRSYAQGGAGYWLSRRALWEIFLRGMERHNEDQAVGEALVAAGIPPVHDERYQTGLGRDEATPPLPDNQVITLHNCGPDRLPANSRHGVERPPEFRVSMLDVHREFFRRDSAGASF
jgi:hypothetical protein